MIVVVAFCGYRLVYQSGKSGRAFSVGFWPKFDKNFEPNLGLRRAFVLGAQKYNQNDLATLLNFSDLTKLSFLFFFFVMI